MGENLLEGLLGLPQLVVHVGELFLPLPVLLLLVNFLLQRPVCVLVLGAKEEAETFVGLPVFPGLLGLVLVEVDPARLDQGRLPPEEVVLEVVVVPEVHRFRSLSLQAL